MLLNCHSYFSLRFGVFSEEELIDIALKNGYSHIALTDVNNTSAAMNMVRLAQLKGVKPIIGVDFRVQVDQKFVALAMNNVGFSEINKHLSYLLHNHLNVENFAPPFEHVVVIYPFKKALTWSEINLKPYEYIGIDIDDLPKLRFSKIRYYIDKLLIFNALTFRSKQDYNVHKLLRTIDLNSLLSKMKVDDFTKYDDKVWSQNELLQHFAQWPNIIYNTQKVIDLCEIDFGFGDKRKSQNLKSYTGNTMADKQMLTKLSYRGLRYRYDTLTPTIKARIDKELSLIDQLDFVSFFLINWDIIQYAKHKNYYHVGRGSGANSIVAYLLGITDVDPIDLDLYFERFMNLYRANPPDFDIDFSWRDRDDMTRYIFERFGTDGKAALLGTYSTFQHSAATRELGKVFGLPKTEIDYLSDGKYEYKKLDKLSQLIVQFADILQDRPNILSVHSAGILISQAPLTNYSATFMPPKGYATTQFDMVIAEDVGLFKFDILAQRGLGKIKDCLSIINNNQPNHVPFDIHHVKPFFVDKAVNNKVKQAQCIGCFYVESPAMRMLLKKLEVDNYLGLVAASSIIRPGVAKSGMMKEYILRHKDPERRKNAHPIMLELMEDTYGVMVYQEDVIKVAHHFAGLSLGEADVLRRGMSGKFRSREEFAKIKSQFFNNCAIKGYEPELISKVWGQIESFAGYAFAKGHSASYAVESYQSLYLKTYYPLEYMVAVLNNGGGFYRPEIYIHEARMHGAKVVQPCVNNSFFETVINGKTIVLGFQHLGSFESDAAFKLINERIKKGDFKSLDDFIDRVQLGIEQLDILIRVNAFDFTGIDKRTLLWQAHYKLNKKPVNDIQKQLFKVPVKDYTLPAFKITELENIYDQIEILGFPLNNPFLLLKERPTSYIKTIDMPNNVGQMVSMMGYLVTAKPTSTHDRKRMYFGTFLDEDGLWIDTVHFPPVAALYPFRGKGVYMLMGKVVDDFGFLSLEIVAMQKLAYWPDPRYATEKAVLLD